MRTLFAFASNKWFLIQLYNYFTQKLATEIWNCNIFVAIFSPAVVCGMMLSHTRGVAVAFSATFSHPLILGRGPRRGLFAALRWGGVV